MAIWGHHAGQGNVHKILSEYIRAKTGVKFGGGNKIYDFIHEHHISYGDLMEAYLNSDDKYDGVRAMMDHLSDDSKTYYPRILAASSTAYRAFYDWEAFAKERKRFRGDEVQTMPEKIVLRAEEKKWAKKFGAYKNSGDVQAAILRGELVDVPVGATSLGFHVDTSQIGNSLKAGDVGGTEQLREIRNRYRHTAKETYGLLLDVAKRFKESNPDSPTLVITALTRSNAYQKKIGGFAAEKLSNHCTGHAFDISVPRSFGPEPAKQKKWLKNLVNVLQEIEFKNAEVLFLAEPVHNPVCIHVSIGPKSVRYYQKYYEKHVTSNEHKPENKKGNFTWPVVLGGATALLLANKFRIQKENARRRQARMNKMPR